MYREILRLSGQAQYEWGNGITAALNVGYNKNDTMAITDPDRADVENVYTAADEHPDWREAMILFTETIIPDLLREGDVEVDAPEEELSEDATVTLSDLDAIEDAEKDS